MSGYSTNDVAELVGMKPEHVRAFVRTGLLTAGVGHIPYHRYRYSFQDVVLLRMAKQLQSARVRPRAIIQALRNLKQRLPAGKSLSSVRVMVDGRDVLVREQDSLWHPDSGQLKLDFNLSALTNEVAPLIRQALRAARSQQHTSADEWYNLGVDLEMVGDHEEAERAYRTAIEQDQGNVDAYVNLGRLCHLSGDQQGALDLFEQALAINPADATAWFNLGVIHESDGSAMKAIAAYEKALAFDNDFVDAHYNLAHLHEQAGDKRAAVRHLAAYKQLVDG